MPKRKAESLMTDTSFAVIETIQGNANVFVEFIPNVWLKPVCKNQPIKARQPAKFYYPRRMKNQTKAQHSKYIKHAKFECMQPKNDNKWDLLDCKVLKIGIGNACLFEVM